MRVEKKENASEEKKRDEEELVASSTASDAGGRPRALQATNSSFRSPVRSSLSRSFAGF